ncbi:hypothetical protein [Streptomyces erythrochromogenes]|uniref:hypothetical protein n=1 Tax=Streptomyces erythrochromogenes TaxID=285574 RepID=UPI003814A481
MDRRRQGLRFAQARNAGNRRIAVLSSALRRLGLDQRNITAPLRVCLRRGVFRDFTPKIAVPAFAVVVFGAAFIDLDRVAKPVTKYLLGHTGHTQVVLTGGLLGALCVGGAFLIGMRGLRLRAPLAESCAVAVCACAAVSRAGPGHRQAALRWLAQNCRDVEIKVRRSARLARMAPFLSHRKRRLRLHAALVIAALREAEARLDREDAADALPPLAHLLITIASNSAAGRVGALLPAETLEGLTPARSWEWLRLAVATLAFVTASVVASALDLPDPVVNVATGTVLLLVVISAYGHARGHRLFQLL